MAEIELNGERVEYTVRESKRAKRISIRCSRNRGLEVVYPLGVSRPEASALLIERASWVLSTIAKLRQDQDGLPTREYQDGEEFLVRGRPHYLRFIRDSATNRIQVRQSDDDLMVCLPDGVSGGDGAAIKLAVVSFYRRLAEAYLRVRVEALADAHGFDFGQIRIKNQKTRWGSCSAKGNINLNLRLMMAPDGAIDYVIIHELCHLRELNHSKAFWSLVEACCPDYRDWRRWFKQYGESLIF